MERFLGDREDEHLMHENTISQDSVRNSRVQLVVNKIDEMGLGGRTGQCKQSK